MLRSNLSVERRKNHPRRNRKLQIMKAAAYCAAAVALCHSASASILHDEATRPNIVLILADDMGFGDVHALNSASTIPTPHIDRLAAEGMTFTDAHTPSAVCTPTRYGLLTGRYCWRTRLKQGVLGGYSPPLIDSDRPTMASMLGSQGYHCAVVGKWHLGMDMPLTAESRQAESKWEDPGVDYRGTIAHAPTTRGFDHGFCVSASLDMPPYVYIANDRFTAVPSLDQPRIPPPAFARGGPRAEGFRFDEVLDRLTQESVDYISRRAKTGKPFFLYFPLTAPHKPTLPHERFRRETELGPYGDFIAQVDWTVGRILQTLDELELAENTLVVFTSDNGSYMYRLSEASRDHANDPRIQGYRADRHLANGPFRGTKADIWEGGHHVPFFARWPGHIARGSQCDEPICLTDLFATSAEIVGVELRTEEAEDSVSLLPMLRGEDRSRGVPVVHHSAGGMFAIRDGRWKLVLGNGSGGREKPRGESFGRPYMLFDLSIDIAEKIDQAQEHPDVVARLSRQFRDIQQSGRSVER